MPFHFFLAQLLQIVSVGVSPFGPRARRGKTAFGRVTQDFMKALRFLEIQFFDLYLAVGQTRVNMSDYANRLLTFGQISVKYSIILNETVRSLQDR
jgi:hypothetical protein